MKIRDSLAVMIGASLAVGASLASAQQVGGAIAQKWWELGSENSSLGRPVTNEISIPGGGRVSCFEGGAIAWQANTGAWAVRGDILSYSWIGEVCSRGNANHMFDLGSEMGAVGFPVGDEYTSSGQSTRDLGCPRGHQIQIVAGIFGSAGWCWNPATRQVTYVGDTLRL